MDPVQMNYTTTEKKLLAIVFALDKFRAYLLSSTVIVFFDHAALKYWLKKLDAKLRLIRWMHFLQEFNLEIRDKKGTNNTVADHLSCIKGKVNPIPIRDDFSDEQLLLVAHSQSWFVDIFNFLIASTFPPNGWRQEPLEPMMQKLFVPKALISDQGTHFSNRAMSSLLEKYGVLHRIATPYHPQTNGQAEVFNREIKKILLKMVHPNRKYWSRLLDDALWAHWIAYRTMLGMSPYWIVFGKACHLLAEIEHRTYWAELEELRLEAYENSRIYKQKVKQFPDSRILRKEFKVGQKVILFHSRLKLIAVKVQNEANNKTFQVNGHQLKHFHEGPTPIIL
ncbi:Retrovirus-related Pol polyprotein from transposon opus, partial [Mucuna pruriens]